MRAERCSLAQWRSRTYSPRVSCGWCGAEWQGTGSVTEDANGQDQGRSDGGISVYIPPNQSTLNFYVVVLSPWPRTNSISCNLYPPKSNSWLRLWAGLENVCGLGDCYDITNRRSSWNIRCILFWWVRKRKGEIIWVNRVSNEVLLESGIQKTSTNAKWYL